MMKRIMAVSFLFIALVCLFRDEFPELLSTTSAGEPQNVKVYTLDSSAVSQYTSWRGHFCGCTAMICHNSSHIAFCPLVS